VENLLRNRVPWGWGPQTGELAPRDRAPRWAARRPVTPPIVPRWRQCSTFQALSTMAQQQVVGAALTFVVDGIALGGAGISSSKARGALRLGEICTTASGRSGAANSRAAS